jgi:hypothetical protein
MTRTYRKEYLRQNLCNICVEWLGYFVLSNSCTSLIERWAYQEEEDWLKITHETRSMELSNVDKVPFVIWHLFSFPLRPSTTHWSVVIEAWSGLLKWSRMIGIKTLRGSVGFEMFLFFSSSVFSFSCADWCLVFFCRENVLQEKVAGSVWPMLL